MATQHEEITTTSAVFVRRSEHHPEYVLLQRRSDMSCVIALLNPALDGPDYMDDGSVFVPRGDAVHPETVCSFYVVDEKDDADEQFELYARILNQEAVRLSRAARTGVSVLSPTEARHHEAEALADRLGLVLKNFPDELVDLIIRGEAEAKVLEQLARTDATWAWLRESMTELEAVAWLMAEPLTEGLAKRPGTTIR